MVWDVVDPALGCLNISAAFKGATAIGSVPVAWPARRGTNVPRAVLSLPRVWRVFVLGQSVCGVPAPALFTGPGAPRLIANDGVDVRAESRDIDATWPIVYASPWTCGVASVLIPGGLWVASGLFLMDLRVGDTRWGLALDAPECAPARVVDLSAMESRKAHLLRDFLAPSRCAFLQSHLGLSVCE
jgi:hypothetical protein